MYLEEGNALDMSVCTMYGGTTVYALPFKLREEGALERNVYR